MYEILCMVANLQVTRRLDNNAQRQTTPNMILLQGQALEILGGVAWHGPETKEMQEPIPPPAPAPQLCMTLHEYFMRFYLSVMVF